MHRRWADVGLGTETVFMTGMKIDTRGCGQELWTPICCVLS